MNQHCVRYPDPLMQTPHYHLRARWNLSQEAVYQALQQRIRHTEVGFIKQLLEDTELRRQGHIFCLRKNQPTKCHWVCLTPNLYIDDVHCVLDSEGWHWRGYNPSFSGNVRRRYTYWV